MNNFVGVIIASLQSNQLLNQAFMPQLWFDHINKWLPSSHVLCHFNLSPHPKWCLVLPGSTICAWWIFFDAASLTPPSLDGIFFSLQHMLHLFTTNSILLLLTCTYMLFFSTYPLLPCCVLLSISIFVCGTKDFS